MKPKVKIIGEKRNIFNVVNQVEEALRKEGLVVEAIRMKEDFYRSASYGDAIQIIKKYVEVE